MYRLLKQFHKYQTQLQDYVKFIPHYISHKSPSYDESKPDVEIQHCLRGGKFCAYPRYDLNVDDGKEILFEDMRQKCIYNVTQNNENSDVETYWNYMTNFFDLCLNKSKFNFECSQEVADLVGIDQKEEKECLLSNIQLKKGELVFSNTLGLLEDDYKTKSKWKIRFFPHILVNNKTFLGEWNAENLMEIICSAFIERPPACIDFMMSEQKEEELGDIGIGFGGYLLIIIFIIAIFGAVLYGCKRYMTKRLHERVEHSDISGRINNVVSTYLALRDPK
jgi:hypothetical protein